MAKVICSPTINTDCARKLPTGQFSIPSSPHGLKSKTQECADPQQHPPTDTCCPPNPTAVNVEELIQQRDAAEEKAAVAQAQLSELRGQLDAEKKKAWDVGYEEGSQEAAAKVAQEQSKETEALKALVQSMQKEQAKLIQQAEDAAVEIGFAAAAKILGQTQVDQRLLIAMVRQAMRKVSDREGLVISLSETDCERMEAVKTNSPQGSQWSKIEFKPDTTLEQGGCIVRSRAGSLEARLDYQLQEIRNCLVKTRTHHSEENPG